MQAFKLKEEFADFSGGSVKMNMSGHTFDVKAALDQNNGLVVIDDATFAAVLRGYEPLEEVQEADIPAGSEPTATVSFEGGASLQVTAPWIPQQPTNTPSPPAVEGPIIPAVHADEPSDTESAVAVGEAVSGQGWRTASSVGRSSSSMPDDDDNSNPDQ